MRWFLGILLIFLLAGSSPGKEYVFQGTAVMNDGTVYPYRLVFSDAGGRVRGYSVTDIGGAGETRTGVSGTLNLSAGQIYFYETDVIRTKTSSDPQSFCYFYAHLKFSYHNGNTILSGDFVSLKYDRKSDCGKGRMSLVSKEEVRHAAPIRDTEAKKVVTPFPRKKKLPARVPAVVADTPAASQPGRQMELECHSPEIAAQVWVKGNALSDVTLRCDTTILAKDIPITSDKMMFHFTATKHNTSALTFSMRNPAVGEHVICMIVTSGDLSHYVEAKTSGGRQVIVLLNVR